MKKLIRRFILTVTMAFMAAAAVEAQNSFSYQAVIRTAKGELVSNQEVGMQFSLIYDGQVVYSETHKAKTSQYGNVQVKVGEGEVVKGSFAAVPWSTMKVMMKIEADPQGGTNYIDLGTIQLQPAPYAMYAPAAGTVHTVQAGEPKSDSDALFEVKDKDGNVVFAVYRDGVRVFVDDSEGKAMATGFAVSGRKAAKDGEEADIFTVNAEGTQVFVNDEGKAMATRFAVSGRKAAKDGSSDLFTVGSTGTQIYIDNDPDSYREKDKATYTGFAVAGRKAAKGEGKYFEINADGTRVYIDPDSNRDEGKPMATGFAVSGRKAAKGENGKYFEINADGTRVYVDEGKAAPTGFAVSGRKAAKGKAAKLFEVNSYGTQIYIDANAKAVQTGFAVSGRKATKEEVKYMVIDANGTNIYVDYEDAKAMQTGFAVSGRKATKDGEQNTILKVNESGTRAYIDDVEGKAMQTGFAVSGRKAAKEGESHILQITSKGTEMSGENLTVQDKDSDQPILTITPKDTKIWTDEFLLTNHDNSLLLTTGNGNGVEVNTDLVVAGDVTQTENFDEAEDIQPIQLLVQKIDTVVIADTASALVATNGYELLKIYGSGLFAQNKYADAEGNNVILFSASGNPTKIQSEAAAAVIMTGASTPDAKLIVWPLKAANNLKISFGLMAAGDTTKRYVNVDAYINVAAPVECQVAVKSEIDSLGTVQFSGPKVYGAKLDLIPTPTEGYHFTHWSDGRQANPRTVLILHDTAFASANFEINTYTLETAAENGKIEVAGEENADGTFNHGTKIELTAIAAEHYHFMNWADGDTATAKRQFTIKSDTAFEAVFAIDSFNIRVEAENGTVTGEGLYPYGAEIELTATADTAAGYHFVNWSDGNTDNPRKLIVPGELKLTANFTKNTYALTYIIDGKIDGDVEMVEYEAELTLRDSLTKTGYTFSGWRYNGKTEKPKTMPKGNLTVTGSWSINQYTITLHENNGVWADGYEKPTSYTIEDETITMPTADNISLDGHTFDGWYTSSQFAEGTKVTAIAHGSTGDTAFYAKWIDNTKPDIIYTTGQIAAAVGGADNKQNFDITYAYYQSDKGEYLHLRYSANNNCQYRNYYLIDNILYADSIVASIAGTSDLVTKHPDFYQQPMKSDTALLMMYELKMRNNGYLSAPDGKRTVIRNEEKVVMETEHNVLMNVDNGKKFINTVLQNILVKGMTYSDGTPCELADLSSLSLSNGQLYDNAADFDNCNKDVFGEEKEQSKLTAKQIENRLTSLKAGFTVKGLAEYGSVQLSPAKERYAYGETLTLTPVIDKNIFKGWSDGCTDTTRTVCVTDNASYTAIFIEPVLYVSDANNANDENYGFTADMPLASIEGAIEKIKQTAMPGLDWTINIIGTLQGPQSIEGEESAEEVIYNYYGSEYTTVIEVYSLGTNSITIKGYGTNAKLFGSWDGENELENEDKYSVLTINTNDSIIIENLTITGGYALGGGGINAFDTKLTIGKDCNITGNKAFSGGGISISGGELILNGGSITNNTATRTKGFSCGGGIDINNYADVTINDGVISRNTASHGGGICAWNSNDNYTGEKSYITINGGTISHNTAHIYISDSYGSPNEGGNGAGMYISNDAIITITGGYITDNEAEDYGGSEGGGLYIYSPDFVSMIGGTISGNKATAGTGIYLCGAITLGDSAKITDEICLRYEYPVTIASELKADIAAVLSPALDRYNDLYPYYTDNPILVPTENISNEVFASALDKFVVTPKVSSNDTTFYYIGTDGKLKKYTSVRFRNCVGVYAQYFMPGPGQTVKNPGIPKHDEYQYEDVTYTFKGWYVMNDKKEYVEFDFDNTMVSDNDIEIFAFWDAEIVVSDKEGAINSIDDADDFMYDTHCDFTILVDGKLTGNQILYNAYWINSLKSLTITGKNGLDDKGMPKDSICGDNGCAFSINTSAPVTISNLKITGGNNISGNAYNSGKGGGLYLSSSTNVTLESGTFITNNTAKTGGGIYNMGTLTINGATISNNNASIGGGGAYIYTGKCDIKGNTVISYNQAIVPESQNSNEDYVGGNGGGLYVVTIPDGADSPEVTIDGSVTIANNSALTENANTSSGVGGGIFVGSSDPETKPSVINSVLIKGEHVAISNNTSTYAGGGIYIADADNLAVDFRAGTISNNTAHGNRIDNGCGGGVYISPRGRFIMRGGFISSNQEKDTYNETYYTGVYVDYHDGKAGTFEMKGDATVAADNCVYLSDESAHITITGELTSTAPVATITPEAYIENICVVEADDPELKSELFKFALTGSTNNGYGIYGGIIVRVLGNNGSDYIDIYDFKNAVESAQDGDVIYLAKTVKVNGPNSNTNNVAIDIAENKTVTVKRYSGFTGYMIETNSFPTGIMSINQGEASGRLILDGGSEDGMEVSGALFYDDAGCTLSNVTFQNNNNVSGKGGGVATNNTANTKLINCVIQNCQAQKGGGFYGNASFTLTNSVIKNCTATDANGGGGIFAGDNLDANRGVRLVDGSFVTNCKANGVRNNYQFEKHVGYTYALYLTATGENSTLSGMDGNYDDAICNVLGCVDLGLPSGNLWAVKNLGANSSEEYGDYYAWGETEPYYSSLGDPITWNKTNGYAWASYTKLSDGAESPTFSKYTDSNSSTLEATDDAATANWGSGWSMPTEADYQELINNCYWQWKNDYNGTGVNGYLLTSNNNGAQIFIPAAGGFADNSKQRTNVGSNGFYWSASLHSTSQANARHLDFSDSWKYLPANGYPRKVGFPIRPVMKP